MALNGDTIVNDQIGPGSFGGPPVPAPSPAPVPPTPNPKDNPGIVSSTKARDTLDKGGSDLDTMTSQPDPYLEYLQKQAVGLQNGTDTTNDSGEKNAIATATTHASTLQTKVQDDYARYKAGLETLGIQSGLSTVAPELQAGRLLQAANDETTKIQTIQQKEDLAVANAKQARINKDAVALKSTLAEIQQLKKDKAAAIKDSLDKRSRDITIANSLSTYAYKTLKGLSPDKQEAFILQTAKDNDISPAALIASLAKEEDTQTKFNLTTDLQRKSLAKGDTATTKPLSTAALNYIKKANPLIDLGYGDTQADADAAVAASKEIQSGIRTAYNNPNLVRNGRFTFDYIKGALANLPQGISRTGFLSSIGKDKLAVGSKKNQEQYGITPEDITTLGW